MTNKLVFWLGLLLVLIFSYFSIRPLFISGFFPMHDDTQVARVYEMYGSLSDGMFPVRWVENLGYGYGYPIFNFYAPLPYYIGSFFIFLGSDPLNATKIMIGVGMVLAGIFMYLLGNSLWGKWGGMISVVFYMYAPYHAVNLYVRGAVGELWAYGFIPLMVWGLYKIFTVSFESEAPARGAGGQNSKFLKWVIVGSLGYAGVILSHNLTAMMATPFLLLFIGVQLIVFYKERKSYAIRHTLYALVLGLMISAFYWIPALSEMRYTNVSSQVGGGADFRDHFICINQLWSGYWGFGGSTAGCRDGLSFQIGRIHVLLTSIVGMLSLIIFLKHKKNTFFYTLLLLFLSLGVSIFLMLNISQPLWEVFSILEYIQYPWRFLVLSSFFVALAVGSVQSEIGMILTSGTQKKILPVVLLMFLIGVVFYYTNFFSPRTILGKPAQDYISSAFIRWDTSKISDEYMPKDFKKPKSASSVPSVLIQPTIEDTNIIIVEKKTNFIKAKINSSNPQQLHINIAYFPAWKMYINGEEKQFSITSYGLGARIPPGMSELILRFEETYIEKIANIVSLAGIGVMLVLIGIIRQAEKGRILI